MFYNFKQRRALYVVKRTNGPYQPTTGTSKHPTTGADSPAYTGGT